MKSCNHATKLICDNGNGITTYWCKVCGSYRHDGNGEIGAWDQPENCLQDDPDKDQSVALVSWDYYVSCESGDWQHFEELDEAMKFINENLDREWTLIEGRTLKLRKKTIPQLEVY